MKVFLFFIAFITLWPIEIYCQNINNVTDEYGSIYIPVNDSTIIYNTKKGKKYEVKLNQISFVDEENGLVDYLRKEHYRPESGDDEYSYRIFFFMLFNSKLKIKEIRGLVLPLDQYTESKKKRVKQYIMGLQRTKNRWKKKSNQKWYVYSLSFVTD